VLTSEFAQILLAIAGLALTFAGFSTVVVLFQHRDIKRWPMRISLRLRTMMYVSLTALLFALVPFGLFYLDISGAGLWALSSGLLAIFGGLLYAEIVVRSKPWIRTRNLGVRFTAVTGVVVLGLIVVLVLNATGAFWEPRFGVYLLGLLWLLVVAGLMFVRLVTFPSLEDELDPEPEPTASHATATAPKRTRSPSRASRSGR
jgi:hypothetical protein